MENSTSIIYTQEGGIATITLYRPSVFNSFNQEMIKSLQHHLDVAAQDVSVRAVVLTGTGKAFCAGQDLGDVLEEKEIDAIIKSMIDESLNNNHRRASCGKLKNGNQFSVEDYLEEY